MNAVQARQNTKRHYQRVVVGNLKQIFKRIQRASLVGRESICWPSYTVKARQYAISQFLHSKGFQLTHLGEKWFQISWKK